MTGTIQQIILTLKKQFVIAKYRGEDAGECFYLCEQIICYSLVDYHSDRTIEPCTCSDGMIKPLSAITGLHLMAITSFPGRICRGERN